MATPKEPSVLKGLPDATATGGTVGSGCTSAPTE